ncbi:MAG: chorismate synthase [Acholeplasmataceae bacterium]
MNHFGNKFRISFYGLSHDEEMGLIIEGVPAGLKLDRMKIEQDLLQRRPDKTGETSRKEQDLFKITTGLYQGYATGQAIHIVLANKDIKSDDYVQFKNHPRPGHADYVANLKYKGFQDPRGGGIFSGRITALLVIAGSIAKMLVPFSFEHEVKQIGTLTDLGRQEDYLEQVKSKKDSVGGMVKVRISKMIAGLGDPFFNKLDSKIAQMLFSIPAIKGVYFGEDLNDVFKNGSEYNDLIVDESGKTKTNHAGGIQGGISNGNDVNIQVYFRPPSSIGIEQQTFDFGSKTIKPLRIAGRHDTTFINRVGIVLENAVAIVLADFYLNRG